MGSKSLPDLSLRQDRSGPAGPGRLWPAWCVLAACVWVAFSPVLGIGFIDLDDPDWIVENPAFRAPAWDQVRFAFTTTKGGVYQPLGWLAQSLIFALFGLDPGSYHRVSLLFHVANVVLLHLLCVRLVARGMPEAAGRLGRSLSWLCAIPVGLYAVHPLRVQLVAWASPVAYLPSLTLSLLATLAYLRAHPPGGGFRRPWMVGASVLIAMAVLAKGSAVVLPFVFLILDAYPLGRLGAGRVSWPAVRTALFEKAPILVFCIALAAVAFVAKRNGLDPEAADGPVIVGRVAQAGFGAWFYLVKTALPFGLTIFHPRPEDEDFLTPMFLACFAGLVIAVTAAIRLRRRWPWLAAGLAAYLALASPYLGLARVSVALVTDHYGHAPTMAWVVLGCAGICRLARRRWPPAVRLGAGAGTLAVAGGLMAMSSAQCRVWDSSEHLWRHAVEQAPWSSRLHDYFGSALAQAGKLDPAIAEFRAALRIRPHDFEATCDLGVALDRAGQTDAAIACLREAARLRPEHPRVLLNLGGALVHRGQVDEAISLYRKAIASRPDDAHLHFNLGVALLHQRKIDPAIDELTRAVALRPWYAEAHATLGGAFALEGRQDEAVVAYRRALRLDPTHSPTRINLGLSLARQGRSDEAIAELREAVRRDRRNAEAHHVLAAILVASGRIGEASAEFEEVLRLRPDHPGARAFLARARNHPM